MAVNVQPTLSISPPSTYCSSPSSSYFKENVPPISCSSRDLLRTKPATYGLSYLRLNLLRAQLPLFRRRGIFVSSVSSIWDALTGGGRPDREALFAVRKGMLLFRVMLKDRWLNLTEKTSWTLGRKLIFGRGDCHCIILIGLKQFRLDVAENPNDTEESIWCFLCEAQVYGVEDFLEVGRDPGPVMREAYALFKNGGDPNELVSDFSNGKENKYFYATLYAGLYHEYQGGFRCC